MEASVVICTYNREALLARALDSLAKSRTAPGLRWEVVLVDNNSSDGTPAAVERRVAGFPVPLRYVFEGRQGKAHALNTGIAQARGAIIVFTDDDVRIAPEWLEAGVRPLLERADIEYTGGPARPMWEVPPPAWLAGDPGRLWGPIALVDYGPEPFIFEERQRIALGVNMAVRRALIDRVGGFDLSLERKGTSLMGQGQAEFFFRTRAAGARGLYVPAMSLEHHVPASRMTHTYYRRWWYWKGVARARMQDAHPISELGVDVRTVPHFAGTPRFMWGSALRSAAAWLLAAVGRDAVARAENQASLAYFAGYARTRAAISRRRDQATPPVPSPQGSSAEAGP